MDRHSFIYPLRTWRGKSPSLRKILRENALAQILLCMALGIVVGMATVTLHHLAMVLHRFFFALPSDEHLSDAAHIKAVRVLFMPIIGGILVGLFMLVMTWWRPRETVDPIEANAIHGGRMSINDSLRLVVATLLSNAAGASVGMEAGYTQAGASITSWVGKRLKLRREDMRILVAAGAGAAIAAAFNAPLAGAFYGFELILGSYIAVALPQVSLCALMATLFMRTFTNGEPIFSLPLDIPGIPLWLYPLFILMGIAAAGLGIITMKLVTRCELTIRDMALPSFLQPAFGGLALAVIALIFPQVLGSGEGAIDNHLHNHWAIMVLLGLLIAKIMGSAISIGSGFRGGLFSSSLFIGCVFGQLFGLLAAHFLPQTNGQIESFMLVGMGSVSASIVGAPITMVLLVLEMTGNFPATTAVLIGVLFSSTITRYFFGYSFSTWRFHLRGLRITGAYDIGWVNDLTMESLMQTDVKSLPISMPLAQMREEVPSGSTRHIFAVDAQGHYKGVIDMAAAYSPDIDKRADTMTLAELAKTPDYFLLPRQNIQEALECFASSEQEELPVVNSAESRMIIGRISEAQMLRRYAHELETRNISQSGAATPAEV